MINNKKWRKDGWFDNRKDYYKFYYSTIDPDKLREQAKDDIVCAFLTGKTSDERRNKDCFNTKREL